MIKSMTGYGSAKGTSGQIELAIELRSVNNRFLDCNIRIPRVYTAFEDSMKSLIQKHVSRGKVDVYVTIDTSKSEDIEIKLNKPLADAYMQVLNKLAFDYDIKNDITALSLAKFPDVLSVEKKESDVEQLAADINNVLEDALADYDKMRAAEGEKLFADMSSRLDTIEKLVTMAEKRSPKTVEEYRTKLVSRMQDVLKSSEIDENRLLLEAAIFADKVAVNEETVRLRSHIAQMRDMLMADEPIGRKMDFLIQELNREANTMGSKGNDVEMARIVVDIKAEIEKIREQVQNVE